MKKTGYIALVLLISFMAIAGINAITPQAPSAITHQIIDTNNQSMLSKAEITIKEIESNPEKTELDTTFFKHPAATWKIDAQQGKNGIMIDIKVEDARLENYRLHLSGNKKIGGDLESTQHAEYLH